MSMPNKNIFAYSGDDSHNTGHWFRNYNFMLMDELTLPALKDAMINGTHYCSYEYEGSGEAKAPRINSISIDKENKAITIDSDDCEVYWISGTDVTSAAGSPMKAVNPSTRKSTVVGYGNDFEYTGFQGNYVRALLKNEFGETAIQPIAFNEGDPSTVERPANKQNDEFLFYPNPARDYVKCIADNNIEMIQIFNMGGQLIKTNVVGNDNQSTIDVTDLTDGVYIIRAVLEGKVESKLLKVIR